MTLSVWPHERVTGWDGRLDTIAACEGFPVVDTIAALTAHYTTDAHAPGYEVPGGDPRIPRLRGSCLAPLIDQGSEPVMSVVFVDVDNPGHTPWPSTQHAALELDRLLDDHGDDCLAAAGMYTTRAGLRMVFRPATPPRVSIYLAWMLGNDGSGGFLGYLSKALGIPFAKDGSGGIDATCAEWHRCYRLPYVVRDGVPTDPVVDLSRLVARTCPWTPREAPMRRVPVPTAGTAENGYQDGIPPVPGAGDVTAAMWDALAQHPAVGKYLEHLRRGEPLAKKGHRDTTLVRTIGAVLAALRSVDPLDAWRVVARSVAADATDGAPSLVKAWGLCQTFARRERDRVTFAAKAAEQPPIVYSGSRYYVLGRDGSYRNPVPGTALCAELEHHGVVGLVTRSPTGTPRKADEYLADYGRGAAQTIAVMGQDRTIYDAATNGGTLYESCCVLRTDVAAKEHPEVAAWLTALAGDDTDTLLDWLATVTDIQHPTAALYLEGPPSVGKGMLVAGLAALWGCGAVAYSDATAAFNGALATNPIVHIDEAITGAAGGGFSAAFRTLVGEATRPLRRKYMESGTIVGSPRAIITANNEDALRIRERLTAHDVEALIARILFIRARLQAAALLVSIGGRSGTAEWVTRGNAPGKIAEHVLWLRDTRAVDHGARFLVHGQPRDFHRDLALTSGINGDLLGCVATVIAEGAQQPGIVCAGDGVVLVNAPAIRRLWAPTLHSPAPADAEIVSALTAISTGQRRVSGRAGKLRYYEVPVASVLRVAELYQIGDPDLLETRCKQQAAGVVVPLRAAAGAL